jgi:alpha,alpha-trehalase
MEKTLADLKAVIFDMDGVVTETATVHAAAWKKLFDAYLEEQAEKSGEEFVPFEEGSDYERYVDGKNRYDGVRSFLEARGMSLPEGTPDDPPENDTICGLGNRKDGYFREWVQEKGVRAYESTVDLIKDLKERGVRIAIVTASRNADMILEAAGVTDLFEEKVDGRLAAERGLAGKPDPATYVEAAKMLAVDPADAAVVEDALSGVESGARGGFGLVVGVARGDQADALRDAGADVVVADLGELALDS